MIGGHGANGTLYPDSAWIFFPKGDPENLVKGKEEESVRDIPDAQAGVRVGPSNPVVPQKNQEQSFP